MPEPGTLWYYTYWFFALFGWWLVPLISLFIYRKKLDKYPILVSIYEKRGENVVFTNDCAGRFNDPINEYKLKNSKDSIPIPEYDWVLQAMYKPTTIFEKFTNLISGKIGHLTLFKYASKQYKPVKVKVDENKYKFVLRPIKNKNGEEVFVNQYVAINPKQAMQMLDFEVIDWDDVNHMTQELRAIALRRSPIQKFLEKYGGVIAILLGVFALIIAGYYVKEMIADASGKAVALINVNNPNSPKAQAQAANAPATVPNIPLIGDLVSPK